MIFKCWKRSKKRIEIGSLFQSYGALYWNLPISLLIWEV